MGDENQIQGVAKEGAYVKSMLLEGATWDTENAALQDAEPMQLYSAFPILLFKPIQKKKAAGDSIYQCPLYMYPVRTGTRERPSFVVWVELKSGEFTPSFWIKRGTAMLLATA